jgi:membrane protein implicated in regulation of membrane protease activity
VLALYLAALILGGGTLVVQLALGHHDAGGHDGGDGADHDASLLTFVASVRFWAFALFAFGFVGTSLTLLGFAGPLLAAVLAGAMGIAAGVTAVSTLRRLRTRTESSHATSVDVVGQIGRVLVPPNESGRAKVRVSVKGAYVDLVARSSEPLAEGDEVLIEECEGSDVTVSRAPKELRR